MSVFSFTTGDDVTAIDVTAALMLAGIRATGVVNPELGSPQHELEQVSQILASARRDLASMQDNRDDLVAEKLELQRTIKQLVDQLQESATGLIKAQGDLVVAEQTLVHKSEALQSARNLQSRALAEKKDVLNAVQAFILDNGEENFPDGFVELMLKHGMPELVGVREFQLSFTVARSFSITLNDCPAGIDDDTIIDVLGQIDICGDEDEDDIQISLSRMLSRLAGDWADGVEVEASSSQYDIEDVEVESA